MRLFVPLKETELKRLCELAEAERRDPRDQAALLIVEGLVRQRRDSHALATQEVAGATR